MNKSLSRLDLSSITPFYMLVIFIMIYGPSPVSLSRFNASSVTFFYITPFHFISPPLYNQQAQE